MKNIFGTDYSISYTLGKFNPKNIALVTFIDNINASVDMYLSFGYNPTTTAVRGVDIYDNAPVEYYNLNGQRVADPSNGIFIRKQGSKTSKVAIK